MVQCLGLELPQVLSRYTMPILDQNKTNTAKVFLLPLKKPSPRLYNESFQKWFVSSINHEYKYQIMVSKQQNGFLSWIFQVCKNLSQQGLAGCRTSVVMFFLKRDMVFGRPKILESNQKRDSSVFKCTVN